MPPDPDAARRAALVATVQAMCALDHAHETPASCLRCYDQQQAYLEAAPTVLALLRDLAAAEGNAKSYWRKRADGFEADVERLAATIVRLEGERDAARAKYEQAVRVNDQLVSTDDLLKAEIAHLRTALAAAEARVGQLEHGYDVLRTALHKAERERDGLRRNNQALAADCAVVVRERDAARAERDEARETAKRLNRRCGTYEAGLAEKLEDARRAGPSLGRMFANAAATKLEAENAHLRTRVAAAKGLRDALEWCRGSSDFNDGGIARDGWTRIVDPALAAFDATATDATGREGGA